MMKWLPWLIFGIFGFFLLKPNLTANLGMIDDHEIPLFLGGDGQIKFWEIPQTILSTEVGEYGSALRYRPSYFTLRVVETALWQDNAKMWYLSRYIMVICAMVILYLISSRYFPRIISYLIVLYCFTLPFWPDILTRLGPSEIYALPALLLFVYGAIKQLSNEGGLWQLIIGYTICVGSKENLLVLLPILLLILITRAYRRVLSVKEVMLYGLAILFTFSILNGILTATVKAGTDVYGGQISYSERIIKLYQYKRYIFDTRHMLFAAVVMVVAIWQFFKKRVGLSHIIVMMMILMGIASQYIFYDSTLPTHMRYDFPGMLLFTALNLVSLHYLLSILPKNIWSLIIRGTTYYCLALILMGLIFTKGYDHIYERGMRNSGITNDFATKLDTVTTRLQENPEYPLIINSDYYLDFEPIVALSRFLAAKSITNPLMLDYREHEQEAGNELMAELLPRLYDVKKLGNSEETFKYFSPLRIPNNGKCFSVSFGKELTSPCEHLVSF